MVSGERRSCADGNRVRCVVVGQNVYEIQPTQVSCSATVGRVTTIYINNKKPQVPFVLTARAHIYLLLSVDVFRIFLCCRRFIFYQLQKANLLSVA